MITITVTNDKRKPLKFIKPIDCFGRPTGEVYQQYVGNEPQKEYLIGAGRCERPISIWYNDDTLDPRAPCYRISSESKKDLRGFVSAVRYVHVEATVTISLEVE